MKSRKPVKIIFWILVVLASVLLATLIYDRDGPAPFNEQKLYDGVTYRRIVEYLPRPMMRMSLL